MKKQIKSLLLVALLGIYCLPAWSQAIPSTEGKDFWVTFLRAADDDPTELKLTISAKEACKVTIENTNAGYSTILDVEANSSTEIGTSTAAQGKRLAKDNCYSSSNERATYTALHVTATKDISLFAGNYRDKSFDATNVLPTAALLDDYLIQTYPPSDHENKPQGSHFAIIAVEDGETTVDFDLTAKTNGGKTGSQSVTLKKGQVYYVWTGKNAGDEADLSGTTVRARSHKKIAVFQGCPHTNIPYSVRDRDHIISQAMPTAYWGTEFGITASRMHRRDIVAVMAINDGTEVYINAEDGGKRLVHTFDFSKDKKHYWTFEIGESLAYCADDEGQSPSHGKLPEPLVADSSCYLTTSCPAGVHLFMVSNRYDNVTEKVKSDTLVSDPAMLWISPIEQVIKEINFATYKTTQAKFHFMNILTPTSNVANMTWNGNSIRQHFHPLMGNPDYSYARIEIQHGSHNLKGTAGFLAHVYGYGQRESYAYSCGSSTVQRSISLNDMPLLIDSVSDKRFCVNDDIEMKLNIGNNDYESVLWDYGDGITYMSDPSASNAEKKTSHHKYTTPGWYDLRVTAVYVNSCTGQKHTETMGLSICVIRPVIKYIPNKVCLPADEAPRPNDTTEIDLSQCQDTIEVPYNYYRNESEYEVPETVWSVGDTVIMGQTVSQSGDLTVTLPEGNAFGCDSTVTYHIIIKKPLILSIDTTSATTCYKDSLTLPYTYTQGDIGNSWLMDVDNNKRIELDLARLFEGMEENTSGELQLPTHTFQPGYYQLQLHVEDYWAKELGLAQEEYTYPVDLAVYYPEDIFTYEFNNVLAVWKKNYGGNDGWDFTNYQWYRNDEEIPGANASVYHSEQPFTVGDVYYVLLTRKDGLVLRSCAQTIEEVTDYNQTAEQAPAKVIRNQQMFIILDGVEYNMFGQRVR